MGTVKSALLAATLLGIGLETPAAAQANLPPPGMTCGISYVAWVGCFLQNVVNGYCAGVQTTVPSSYNCGYPSVTQQAAGGYRNANDGDRGQPSGLGFYNQAWNQPNATNSTQYILPKGTACGFKEACNDSGERCMGYDAHNSCPPGWQRKSASDLNAPNGCVFDWCEYQDPNNLCQYDSCYYNLPHGLVCGLTDSDKSLANGGGQCLGVATTTGCPGGFVLYGFFDAGRPAGHGVGFCMKP